MVEAEVWKPIEGSNPAAWVSSYGNIIQDGKKIKMRLDSEGYLRCNIKGIGRDRAHRFVAEAFIDNPKNLPIVDHIDGNKSNNNVNNLRWVTPKENNDYATSKGVYADTSPKGEIGCINVNTHEVKIYKNQADYARQYNIDDSMPNKILKNKRFTGQGGNALFYKKDLVDIFYKLADVLGFEVNKKYSER